MNRHSETMVKQISTESSLNPRVIAGVDGTAANWCAVSWAATEARRVGRPLLLVATGEATTATAPADSLEPESSSKRLTRDLLEGARTRLGSHLLDVSTRVLTGEPSRALLQVAGKDDLLVIGKRRGSPWSSAVLGSTALAVAARCTGPVVVIPEYWSVAEHRSQHIVAGVDEQHDSHVLDLAFDRARTLAVPLVVEHAIPTEAEPWDTARQRLADSAAPWVEAYSDVEVSFRCHSLTPTVSLLGAATDAQLLMVGRHFEAHAGAIEHHSTVSTVLHHATCQVLVVPQVAGNS